MVPTQLSGIFDSSAIELVAEFDGELSLVGEFDSSVIRLFGEIDEEVFLSTDEGSILITDEGVGISLT